MIEKKTCLFCGAALHGRSDKRYCDDLCRNNYHHKNKKDVFSLVKNVNSLLLRNREILRELSRNNRTLVDKCELLNRGFDFELITSVRKTKRNEEYRIVYDYAYKFVDENEVLLIKY